MLKSKKIFFSLGFFCVLAVVLRTVLIINNTSNEGFYIDQSSKLVLLLRIIFIGFSLVAFILPLFDNFPNENRSRNNDKLLGLSMSVLGGIIMFVGLVEFFVMFQLVWSSNFSELIYLIKNTPNSLIKIIFSIVSFVTGWFITTISVKILNNRSICNNYFLSVVLVFWGVLRAMLFTKTHDTIVTIDDNLYSVIAIIFSISFLFGVSRLLFDIGCNSGYKMAISSGFVMIFFGILDTVPNYIAFFMKKNIFFSVRDTNGIADLSLAMFAVVFLYIIIFKSGENINVFERKNLS